MLPRTAFVLYCDGKSEETDFQAYACETDTGGRTSKSKKRPRSIESKKLRNRASRLRAKQKQRNAAL